MRAVISAFVLLSAATAAQAQPYGSPLSLEQSRRVAAAAQAEAARSRDQVTVAVVEPSGQPVLLERMDGAIYASIVLAQEKARSAAAFRQPTVNFQNTAKTEPFILGVTGAAPVEGGVPIVVAGRVVGAVGVSGSSPEDDGRIARAGAAALAAGG